MGKIHAWNQCLVLVPLGRAMIIWIGAAVVAFVACGLMVSAIMAIGLRVLAVIASARVNVDVAGNLLLLMCGAAGGLLPGAVLGVAWPRQRTALLAGLVGTGLVWAEAASLAPWSYHVLESALPRDVWFYAGFGLCLAASTVAYRAAARWRLKARE